MNEGYTIRHIPAQEYKVCHGCKYLSIVPRVFGHKTVTHNYICTNPESLLKVPFYNDARMPKTYSQDEVRMIHYNHEGECIVPSWCPYLKQKEE